MNKPTLFFSHSSKDKELVLSIKNKLDMVTGGVMEIFMSSDGQSIPFGTNWIHKIEEGLKAAKLMFVFVTENSISSGWIYFEAGYAYSKDIQVVPVGIGIDIGALKAPLNLLQGFNVLSEDSLNNFIAIINRTFNYHFSNGFEYCDYLEVTKNLSLQRFDTTEFEEIVDKVEFEIYDKDTTLEGEKVRYDIDEFFNNVVTYLNNNGISFSRDDNYQQEECSCLVFFGIKMIWYKEKQVLAQNQSVFCKSTKVTVSVSPYNFLMSFTLLKKLLKLIKNKDDGYIRVHLKGKYTYVGSAENGSSILSNHTEFKVDASHIGGYACRELGLKFCIFDINLYSGRYGVHSAPDYVASIIFQLDDIHAENIVELINRLYNVGFIFQK